jgi:hypothetical protein
MRYLALLIAAAVVLVAAAPASAQSESCVPRASKSRAQPATYARAKLVVDRYAATTMRDCDGVVGMGIGAAAGVERPDPKRREHVIVIYLRDSASKPKRAKSIAGVTIRYVVTGEFQAL